MDIIVENEGLNGVANYEPLKAWALETAQKYKSVVVTDESIRSAKQDIADLRNLAKKISDYRIALKKEHEKKIEKTIQQCIELTQILTDAASSMDVQVKELEDGVKRQKKQEIEEYFNSVAGDTAIVLSFEKVFDQKWLNKTAKMDDIKSSIDMTLNAVKKNLGILHGMQSQYETEMIEAYLDSLDMGVALETKNRLEEKAAQIARMKAEQEQKKQEVQQSVVQPKPVPVQQPIPAPKQEPVKFYDVRLFMTETQKNLFKNFVVSNGIKYTKVPKQ
jgi:hypothetical protein